MGFFISEKDIPVPRRLQPIGVHLFSKGWKKVCPGGKPGRGALEYRIIGLQKSPILHHSLNPLFHSLWIEVGEFLRIEVNTAVVAVARLPVFVFGVADAAAVRAHDE